MSGYIFKTQPGSVGKDETGPSGWESNLRPHKFRAMFCQLSYRGHCREHVYVFSLYMVVMPMNRSVYLK